jgi:hypothetical protein
VARRAPRLAAGRVRGGARKWALIEKASPNVSLDEQGDEA